MKELAAAYDVVEAEAPKLFQFDPAMKMSMYRVTLGQNGRSPNLGNPRSLMHEIYLQSLAYVQESVGVDYLPKDVLRGPMQNMNVPATQLNALRPRRCRRSRRGLTPMTPIERIHDG